ncbi:MAG: hypothetical protein ACJATS_001287, partial [Psychroserpens sp.]
MVRARFWPNYSGFSIRFDDDDVIACTRTKLRAEMEIPKKFSSNPNGSSKSVMISVRVVI